MIKDQIRKARKDAGLSQTELANLCDWDQGRQSHYENGRYEPNFEQIRLIAKHTNKSPSYFIGDDFSITNDDRLDNISFADQPNSFVPIISWVQAGNWEEAIDLHEPGNCDTEIARINGGKNVYALRVEGDSMTAPPGVMPSYPQGFYIQIDPDQQPAIGDCIIARLSGKNEVTFKQLQSDSGRHYLKPLNPSHPPIFDKFHVLGKVIGASFKA